MKGFMVNDTKLLANFGNPIQQGIFDQEQPTVQGIIDNAKEKTDRKLKADKSARGKAGSRSPKRDDPKGVLRESKLNGQDKKRQDNLESADLLGDDTKSEQDLADAQRESDEKRSPSGEQPALAQDGNDLFANNGKLESDLIK